MSTSQETAFPRLSTAEFAVLKSLATARDYVEGETIFRAGQADIDLFVVESGQIDILNPANEPGRLRPWAEVRCSSRKNASPHG